MDVQLKPSRSKIIKNTFLNMLVGVIALTSFSFSFDTKTEAYSRTVGSEVGIEVQRTTDMFYMFIDPACCCTQAILEAFEDKSQDIADLINPSTDTIIGILSLEIEDSKLREDEMVNLKIVNGFYSFSDENNPPPPAIQAPPSVPAEGLCRPIDMNNPEDLKWYQENITDRFESGGDYQAMNCSGAYGRYQMMPAYASPPNANAWCKSGGAGCCGSTGTMTKQCKGKAKSFNTYAWMSSQSCQDNMFDKLTKDNAKQLSKKYPVTSCNMYLVHQQGAGGYAFLMGGKNPYGSLSKLQASVKQNVGAKAYSAGDSSTEAGLREIYKDFWKKKFGADPFGGNGTAGAGSAGATTGSYGDLTNATNTASQPVARDGFRREGIIFELYKETHNLEVMWKLIESRTDKTLIRTKE